MLTDFAREAGPTSRIRRAPNRQILDRRKISRVETRAHLAVDRRDLFIRELHAWAARRWNEPPAVTLNH